MMLLLTVSTDLGYKPSITITLNLGSKCHRSARFPLSVTVFACYLCVIQGSAKRWTLGCVNPASWSWLPLAVGGGESSLNLGPTL